MKAVYECYKCKSRKLTTSVPMRCMDCGGAIAMKVRDTTIPRLYSTSGKLSDAGTVLCDAVAVSKMLPGFDFECVEELL